MIARGVFHLSKSAAGDEISGYHLQAAIAAVHCAAQDYESTDWSRILLSYDRLVEIDDSPVIALNRAVAVAKCMAPTPACEQSRPFKTCNRSIRIICSTPLSASSRSN